MKLKHQVLLAALVAAAALVGCDRRAGDGTGTSGSATSASSPMPGASR